MASWLVGGRSVKCEYAAMRSSESCCAVLRMRRRIANTDRVSIKVASNHSSEQRSEAVDWTRGRAREVSSRELPVLAATGTSLSVAHVRTECGQRP